MEYVNSQDFIFDRLRLCCINGKIDDVLIDDTWHCFYWKDNVKTCSFVNCPLLIL